MQRHVKNRHTSKAKNKEVWRYPGSDGWSILEFIGGAVVGYIVVYALSYVLGLIGAGLYVIFFTFVTWKAVKDNNRRVLEFSAGLGGLVITFIQYEILRKYGIGVPVFLASLLVGGVIFFIFALLWAVAYSGGQYTNATVLLATGTSESIQPGHYYYMNFTVYSQANLTGQLYIDSGINVYLMSRGSFRLFKTLGLGSVVPIWEYGTPGASEISVGVSPGNYTLVLDNEGTKTNSFTVEGSMELSK